MREKKYNVHEQPITGLCAWREEGGGGDFWIRWKEAYALACTPEFLSVYFALLPFTLRNVWGSVQHQFNTKVKATPSLQHSKKECVVLTCTHGLLCPIK